MTDSWVYLFMVILVVVGGAIVYYTGKKFGKEGAGKESRAKAKRNRGKGE